MQPLTLVNYGNGGEGKTSVVKNLFDEEYVCHVYGKHQYCNGNIETPLVVVLEEADGDVDINKFDGLCDGTFPLTRKFDQQ